MEYKELVPGVRLPVFGFGTSKPRSTADAHYYQEKELRIAEIRRAVEYGCTHIDTASLYGNGRVEILVGEAMKAFDRSSIFLTTKLRREYCEYQRVFIELDESLRRLDTTYVDLYLIHAPSPDIPIHETMRAMNELVDLGKVRFIGVSNFTSAQLAEAQACSKHRIVVNQIEYNLMTRNHGSFTSDMESDIIPYCQKNGVLIVAYRPLAGGVLPLVADEYLAPLVGKYQKTTSQIAINWLIHKPGIVTLLKSRKKEHLEEDLGSIGWAMESSDHDYLDRLFFLH